MQQSIRPILSCLVLLSLLTLGCNSEATALRCIQETTSSLVAKKGYQNLLYALNSHIASRPGNSADVLEHVAGKNVLFNEQMTRAIATELLIYNKADGSRHGYGTVYLATLREDSGWVFARGNAPNFFLSVRDVQLRVTLDSKKLEEHILGRFVDDGRPLARICDPCNSDPSASADV